MRRIIEHERPIRGETRRLSAVNKVKTGKGPEVNRSFQTCLRFLLQKLSSLSTSTQHWTLAYQLTPPFLCRLRLLVIIFANRQYNNFSFGCTLNGGSPIIYCRVITLSSHRAGAARSSGPERQPRVHCHQNCKRAWYKSLQPPQIWARAPINDASHSDFRLLQLCSFPWSCWDHRIFSTSINLL